MSISIRLNPNKYLAVAWLIAITCISNPNCFSQQLEEILPAPVGPAFGPEPPPPAVNGRLGEAFYRIKDITYPDGDRDNYVNGISLVVGLSQSGGRAEQTRIMAENYFQRNGIQVTGAETRAMSAVQVTGIIPPYAKKGERIQVTVSVVDDATSIRGGVLIKTPLRGLDGQIYAIAEGQILGGGVAAGGAAANVQRDHPTVGVCNAIVEREICADFPTSTDRIRLILRNKENSTAVSIANVLNSVFPNTSRAIDHGTVEVLMPQTFLNRRPDFLSVIGKLAVPVDPRAKVIINQKTGTIILGQNVRISPVVFAKGSLVISTAETPVASQPAPLSQGETVVLPRTELSVVESGGPYSTLGGGTTVGDLGRALNELGFTPNLMIEMFSSLQKAGVLQAELIIE